MGAGACRPPPQERCSPCRGYAEGAHAGRRGLRSGHAGLPFKKTCPLELGKWYRTPFCRGTEHGGLQGAPGNGWDGEKGFNDSGLWDYRHARGGAEGSPASDSGGVGRPRCGRSHGAGFGVGRDPRVEGLRAGPTWMDVGARAARAAVTGPGPGRDYLRPKAGKRCFFQRSSWAMSGPAGWSAMYFRPTLSRSLRRLMMSSGVPVR